jgi:hypothetical protein
LIFIGRGWLLQHRWSVFANTGMIVSKNKRASVVVISLAAHPEIAGIPCLFTIKTRISQDHYHANRKESAE